MGWKYKNVLQWNVVYIVLVYSTVFRCYNPFLGFLFTFHPSARLYFHFTHLFMYSWTECVWVASFFFCLYAALFPPHSHWNAVFVHIQNEHQMFSRTKKIFENECVSIFIHVLWLINVLALYLNEVRFWFDCTLWCSGVI